MSQFITIEGGEGVGKSTALAFINQYLNERGVDFIITREPGGTPIAETIRRTLLAHFDEVMLPKTELLLMFAARVQHVEQVVKPALAAGKLVICDRYIDASYAYQGGGRELGFETIFALEQLLELGLTIDATLLLDAPVEVGFERLEKSRETKDRIEHEQQQFFERVRNAYLERLTAEPERFHIVDAAKTVDEVRQRIRAILDELIV